jgi:tetrahydromethanopterin S-methyltransferase subunit F
MTRGGGERSDEERGFSAEEMAGLCVGVVLAVIVLVAVTLALCWWKSR